MKIVIKTEANEIAALVMGLQERHKGKKGPERIRGITIETDELIDSSIRDTRQAIKESM